MSMFGSLRYMAMMSGFSGSGNTGSGGGGLPAGGSPHQMLVTDKDGKTVWEDRKLYSEYIDEVILAETEPVFNPDYGTVLTTPLSLEHGETYTVTWNGVEYESEFRSVVTAEGGGDVLGDVSPFTGGESTGEPFLLMMVPPEQIAERGISAIVQPIDGSTQITISITRKGWKHHKIPMEHLPDGYPDETVGLGYILPETIFVGEGTQWMTMEPINGNVEVGKTYTVNYNGVEFDSVCRTLEGLPCIGNVAALEGSGDTGEPCVVAIVPDALKEQMGGASVAVMPLDEPTEVKLSIKGIMSIVKKLDMKYLPDGIPYVNEEEKTIVNLGTYAMNDNHDAPITTPKGKLSYGAEYKVTFQGKEYTCVANMEDGGVFGRMLYVGDNAIGDSNPPFEYPFVYRDFENPGVAAFLGYNAAVSVEDSSLTSCEFGIVEPAGSIHKIDKKYLPNDLVVKSDIKRTLTLKATTLDGKTFVWTLIRAE